MLQKVALTILSILAINKFAYAGNYMGISFSHHDWEIACDNTRTCRAAGYQSDEDELSISVLLTRMAGSSESVKGQVMIGNYSDEERPSWLPSSFAGALKVNNKNNGNVLFNKELIGELSEGQVKALIGALSHNSEIEFVFGRHVWHLSDKGAAAVFLKMDEFQGRIGTGGALIKKGRDDESKVLKALPKPVIYVPKVIGEPNNGKRISVSDATAWVHILKATTNEDDCPTLFQENVGGNEIILTPLSGGRSLLSTLCWRAAYNEGYGYWVIKDAGPKQPVLVTTLASGYRNGEISSSQKGRGLGDCWSSEGWAWNGEAFIHSESSSTGMCKLVAPGGTWSLPTFISDVRHK